jgi:hypothetical protein
MLTSLAQSSSKTSSTLGDKFLCCGVEVVIWGTADVVAVAGAGCPVIAAIVAPAFAEPEDFADFFFPFFFSYS